MRRSITISFATAMFALAACTVRSTPTPTPAPQATATLPPAATATLAAPTLGAPSTATTAAIPSDTPAPTNTTAAASPTPSAVPVTATPTVPPTPDPNEAVGDVIYQDKLDGKGGWFWTFSDDVATFGVVDGKLKATMKAANAGWRFTISPNTLQFGSQQVRMTAHTVSCGPNDEYGLMLRVKPNADNTTYSGYLFNLRCSGAASFDRIEGTNRTAIVDWTPSPAIKAGAPADNTLLVWAAGGEFRLYVNDQYLFTAKDNSLTAGFYGVYIYDRTAGGETVLFDTLVARSVAK